MEPGRQTRWFRSPLQVQVTKGILGSGSKLVTRDVDLRGGEWEVGGDFESGHHRAPLLVPPSDTLA